MTKPVVFIVGSIEAGPIVDMFMEEGWFIGETMKGSDLIQFTGGHDVSPGFYNELKHNRTWCWPNRDIYEKLVFLLAKDQGIPMAGICRGGQFLNVMSGGKLWQDVDGHQIVGMHWAKCHVDKEEIPVTSVHHQMMRPSTKGQVLLTSRASTFKERMSKGGQVVKVMNDGEDIEAVYYQHTGSLCYQPHPEYTHVEGVKACRDKYFKYLEHFFYLR